MSKDPLSEETIYDETGVKSANQKINLHELIIYRLIDDDKKQLFVYDGDYTLILVDKIVRLCKGNPEECGTNNSLRNNACKYIVLKKRIRNKFVATHTIY